MSKFGVWYGQTFSASPIAQSLVAQPKIMLPKSMRRKSVPRPQLAPGGRGFNSGTKQIDFSPGVRVSGGMFRDPFAQRPLVERAKTVVNLAPSPYKDLQVTQGVYPGDAAAAAASSRVPNFILDGRREGFTTPATGSAVNAAHPEIKTAIVQETQALMQEDAEEKAVVQESTLKQAFVFAKEHPFLTAGGAFLALRLLKIL